MLGVLYIIICKFTNNAILNILLKNEFIEKLIPKTKQNRLYYLILEYYFHYFFYNR